MHRWWLCQSFKLGTWSVTCEASDAAGNTGSASFDVNVTAQTASNIVADVCYR